MKQETINLPIQTFSILMNKVNYNITEFIRNTNISPNTLFISPLDKDVLIMCGGLPSELFGLKVVCTDGDMAVGYIQECNLCD